MRHPPSPEGDAGVARRDRRPAGPVSWAPAVPGCPPVWGKLFGTARRTPPGPAGAVRPVLAPPAAASAPPRECGNREPTRAAGEAPVAPTRGGGAAGRPAAGRAGHAALRRPGRGAQQRRGPEGLPGTRALILLCDPDELMGRTTTPPRARGGVLRSGKQLDLNTDWYENGGPAARLAATTASLSPLPISAPAGSPRPAPRRLRRPPSRPFAKAGLV